MVLSSNHNIFMVNYLYETDTFCRKIKKPETRRRFNTNGACNSYRFKPKRDNRLGSRNKLA